MTWPDHAVAQRQAADLLDLHLKHLRRDELHAPAAAAGAWRGC